MDPELFKLLSGLRLDLLFGGERFRELDVAQAYLSGHQYHARRYNWDSALIGYGGEMSLQATWYVPMENRRPSVRRDLPKVIVQRLTAMTLGGEQWPELKVVGDAKAEDFLLEMHRLADTRTHWVELRDKGGACGTACFSFGFVDGKPRVRIHDAKHCKVLRWFDRDEFVVQSAIKAYRFEQLEIVDGKPKMVPYWSVRYWDTEVEIVWDPVPERLVQDGTWASVVRRYPAQHGYGECPFFWVQNWPDSDHEDGISDYVGMNGKFDQINYLASATTKGTISNVDPTLVIKDDPGNNNGTVKKGSENAIYCKGGADYLEIAGTSVQAAEAWEEKLEKWCLDEACVVVPSGDATTKPESGEAIKMRFLPMTSKCDVYRGQYGKALVRLSVAMLKAARRLLNQAPGPIVTTADGRRLQAIPTLAIEPKRIEKMGEDRRVTVIEEPRVPGTSESVELNWRTYFSPTPADVNQIVTSATTAQGKTISDATAVRATAQIYGVKDIERELADIEAEREARAMAFPGPEGTFGAGPKPKAGDTDEADEE